MTTFTEYAEENTAFASARARFEELLNQPIGYFDDRTYLEVADEWFQEQERRGQKTLTLAERMAIINKELDRYSKYQKLPWYIHLWNWFTDSAPVFSEIGLKKIWYGHHECRKEMDIVANEHASVGDRSASAVFFRGRALEASFPWSWRKIFKILGDGLMAFSKILIWSPTKSAATSLTVLPEAMPSRENFPHHPSPWPIAIGRIGNAIVEESRALKEESRKLREGVDAFSEGVDKLKQKLDAIQQDDATIRRQHAEINACLDRLEEAKAAQLASQGNTPTDSTKASTPHTSPSYFTSKLVERHLSEDFETRRHSESSSSDEAEGPSQQPSRSPSLGPGNRGF